MITVGFIVLIAVLLAATPWRRLPRAGRFWAAAVCLNVLIFFSMPTTLATSPWRPVVQRILVWSAGAGVGLFVIGLVLWTRQDRAASVGRHWIVPLILGLLPAILYALIWLIGPIY